MARTASAKKAKEGKGRAAGAAPAAAPLADLREAVALHQAGRLAEAEKIYRQVLLADPRHGDALHLLGLIEKQKGHYREAIELIRRALERLPDSAALYGNLGNTYRDSGQLAEAVAAYTRALELQPDFPECLNNFGNALKEASAFDQAAEKYQAALRLQPDYADAWNNLGGVWHKQGRLTEAAAHYRKAIEFNPRYAMAHYNLGNALVDGGQLVEAIGHFRRAVELDPGYVEAWGSLVRQLQTTCDWRDYDALCAQLQKLGAETGDGRVFPFAYVALPSSQAEQLACARLWARRQYRPQLEYQALHPFSFAGRRHDRLRIGYLSSDFHNHATAYLMAEVFELHDRSRFETFAFSLWPDDGKEMRRRLLRAFDHFVDLQGLSQQEAARRIHEAGIDILVDLKGYTKDTGTPIMAYRPAPVQAQHLGFPGTLGAPFIDYVVTDDFVTPPEDAPNYDEKFAFLRHCYQPNDRQRRIAEAPGRADCGLPAEGVVFCCFNHTYKITPAMFGLWCRILAAAPGSVLWLLKSNKWAEENLRREAAERGVAAERIVFAEEMPLERHLARLQLADVFLDTRPYNAHTTASDALWAGVPVVTWAGDTFASRVAGSLLRAVGLPELITHSAADYEALALRLARAPDELAAVKRKLAAQRSTAPLFDSAGFTRDLEALFDRMWARHQSGEPPAEIRLPEAPAAAMPAPQARRPLPINLVHVWHDRHKPIFEPLMAQLDGALRAGGIEPSRSENELRPDAVNILVGASIFVCDQLREQARGLRYVVYQMEQLSDREGRFRARPNYVEFLRQADWVWDYSAANIAALKAQGIGRISHVPVGYHPSLERLRHGRSRDIDVLFYGSLTERRQAVLAALQQAGLRVRASFGEYGEALDELIERSHVVLNMHQFDNVDTLEEVRLSYLLANGCFVVSEAADHNPYGDGMVVAPYGRLAETCREYLAAGEARRDEVARRGYAAIRRLDYGTLVGAALAEMAGALPLPPWDAERPGAANTAVLSLSWLDGIDTVSGHLPGSGASTRLQRTVKWLDYYRPLLGDLGAGRVILVDDASDLAAVQSLGGNLRDAELRLLERATTRPWLEIVRFEQHLPRKSAKDYPYFWRAMALVPKLARHFGLRKVIFNETDCFLLTPRIVAFVRQLSAGYTAFWCAKYNFPESALAVLCADQFGRFEAACTEDAYLRYNERPAETVLPFSQYVSSGFKGDRYGEAGVGQAVDMDFYAQCPVPVRVTFDLAKTLRLNIVQVAINEHKAIFEDVIAALHGALADLGVACTRTENVYVAGALNILVGSANFASDLLLESLKGRPYIVYQMEQLAQDRGHLPKYPRYPELLRGALRVWDYSAANIRELERLGVDKALHVPAGYHRSLEACRQDQAKDVDVLFYGTLSDRRRRVLEALEAAGLAVKVLFGVYGEERNSWIERSRIVINIHCDEMDTLEEVRLSYLLANRCFVVSEVADHDPYGGGVVFCPYESLVETCKHYLALPEAQRQTIAQAGYAAIRRLDLAELLKGALQEMAELLPTATGAAPAAATPASPYYQYARPEVAGLVPTDAREILDIGCGAGMLGKSLKDRQPCRVTGIELMPEIAARAAQVLDRVIPGDVFAALPALPDGQFDVVVMADVLEHVADTDRLLQGAARKLRAGGQLVLSLPNVRHWSVLKGLLEGSWDYQAQGILDRTHMRFFTKASALEALSRNGFRVERLMATAVSGHPVPEGLGPVLQTFGIAAQTLHEEAQCFQYLFLCVRTEAA